MVDPEQLAREVPDGDTGVLLAKGPGVMSGGYWQDDAATKAAFVDGYFNTGAPGRVTGYLPEPAAVSRMCMPSCPRMATLSNMKSLVEGTYKARL